MYFELNRKLNNIGGILVVEQMRAVRLFAPGDVRCVEVDKPQIEESDDILVKVKSCGVCGSDIPRVTEKGAHEMPITIGHEFAGIIEETGSGVIDFREGDRVTIMPLIPCGECNYCQIGKYMLCDDYAYYGSRIDGAMAEYIRVKANNLLKLPKNVDYEMGSMTDPASVALHAIRKADFEPGQKAVVFGMGPIGYFTMQWLKAVGFNEVYVVDIFEEKLDLASRLGADLCINGKSEDVADVIDDKTDGEGVDLAVEFAGTPVTQVQAIEAVRKMGQVVYAGITYEDLVIPNKVLNSILRGELAIYGAWNSSIANLPINEWQDSLEFMNSGKLKANPLISHRFKLEECQECFDMMYNRTEIFNKVLFKPEE